MDILLDELSACIPDATGAVLTQVILRVSSAVEQGQDSESPPPAAALH